MRFVRNLSIRTKIITVLVLIFLIIVIENFALDSFMKKVLMKEKEAQLASLIDNAYSNRVLL